MDNSKASRFFPVRPTCVCVGWLGAVVVIAATWSLNPAYGSENLATTSAQGSGCEKLQEQLTASQEALAERSPELQERVQAIAASLQGLEDAGESVPAAKLAEQKDTLITERTALQNELKFLESAHTAWQAALDACENAARFLQALAQFQAGTAQGRELRRQRPGRVAGSARPNPKRRRCPGRARRCAHVAACPTGGADRDG